MTDEHRYQDGMIRLVGAVVRRAIIDGHPGCHRTNRNHDTWKPRDQREAQSWVRDAFVRDRRRMRIIEDVWSKPFDQTVRLLGNQTVGEATG